MEKITSVKLGQHFDGVINHLTDNGRFKNASEAIRAGLRLLEEQETEYQTKLAVLRQAIDEGEESGFSDKTIDDIWQDTKANGDRL